MTRRNSVRDRRECFDSNKYVDALGRTVMDCHICGGVILPATEKWEAEHVLMRALGGTVVKPAHYSPCHKAKTKVDVKTYSKAKRVGDRNFGIRQSKGFPKPKGAKFDWSRGRYVREERS